MVAYNFQRPFVPLIRSGLKTQTVRAGPRGRHPAVGARIQLYTGQRTAACEKIIADPVCESVTPVTLDLAKPSYSIILGVRPLGVEEAAMFAIADGFRRLTVEGKVDFLFSLACFLDFFREKYGDGPHQMYAVAWRPEPASASASQDLFAAA